MRTRERRIGRSVRRLIGLLTILTFFVWVRGCAVRPMADYAGSHFNQGKNGLWLGVDWVDKPHTVSEIQSLADYLVQKQIRYTFVYISYLRPDTGQFNPTFSGAASFVTTFHQRQPGIKLLGWLGIPLPSIGGTVNLADPHSRKLITDLSAHLVTDLGFDGVQLDPEIIQSGDQTLLALLAETRQAIGAQSVLSLASEKIQPILPDWSLINSHLGWSATYYRQIADQVDQQLYRI